MKGNQLTLAIVLSIMVSLLFSACGSVIPPIFRLSAPTMTPGLVAPHASSNAAPKLNGRIALGYYTGSQSSYAALVSFTPFMNVVSADIYTVRSDGSLVGSDDLGVAAFGRSHGIQTYACISNYNSDPAINNFDPKLAQAAIVTHKTQVISNLVALAQHAGFDGINIDFENLTYSANIDDARADFSSFIHDLAAQLHANGIKLIVSVPAKTSDSKDDIWSYPFDLAALGQDADYLQLMTYDQHSPSSAPGPISGADWVENCVVFTTSLVDPSRLLIGLPAYGYDWDLTASNPGKNTYSATNFSWTDIPTLFAKTSAEAQWDIGSQSPFVTYKENGHDHVAWYESAGSIQAKTKLLSEYNLAGFSVWSLGKEDQNFWQAARDGAK